MSGPGDIGGEVSGDEAAWRDLVARFDDPADQSLADAPWPSLEDVPEEPAAGPGPAEAPDSAGPAEIPGRRPGALPSDRIRVIPYSSDPRSYAPPDETDEKYVPVPLPPPAKLDAVAKAAWVGVIGGPGYLLVVSLILHMTVSPLAAFVAVAAFVGGFITLVIRLGDHSRRDDDDNGAVL